jgi:hypothetical protein
VVLSAGASGCWGSYPGAAWEEQGEGGGREEGDFPLAAAAGRGGRHRSGGRLGLGGATFLGPLLGQTVARV